jgi:hypothetical protein
MAIFHRANTTIFSCDEINLEDPKWFGVTVLLRVPPTADPEQLEQLNRRLIQQAISLKCGIDVPEDNIFKVFYDFVLWTASTDHATQIMQITDIDIAGVKIVVYPWTPTFNCTTISIDNLPLHDHSIAPAKRPRDEICEHLKITVYGVPPHLTKAQTIPRVFPNICQPSNMHIDKENIIYSFKTYACRADIPSTWNLGIRRGTMLHLWPIWIDVKSCAPPTQASWARQGNSVTTEPCSINVTLYANKSHSYCRCEQREGPVLIVPHT